MTHPKIVGLSDGAFRLWVWGLTYAQAHLTDGWIPDAAIRQQRPTSRAHQDLITAGLWETATGGVQIHDYLHWNDSRNTVTERKQNARERKAKWLAQHGGRNTSGAPTVN